MVIYGTALLSICLIVGLVIGRALGFVVGVDTNVGGVGIAMLLLIVLCERLDTAKRLHPSSSQGILYWNAIYIPIVVAMAASQDVAKAATGGLIAMVAGLLVVLVCFALVPVFSRFGDANTDRSKSAKFESENLSSKGKPL